jgi:cytochrome c oxidase assembly protein subunit 15
LAKTFFSKLSLSKLALAASCFALAVVALGAYTRLIDAGLGCPDWPGCYGQMTVPVSPQSTALAKQLFPGLHINPAKAWAEMIHRYFVGCLSIFICVVLACIAGIKKYRTDSNITLGLTLLVLMGYQIWLGQLTVTLLLLPVVVSQHLLGGFLILSSLWLIYLNNKPRRYAAPPISRKTAHFLLPWAALAVMVVILQIILGAWTSTNYASFSCPDFPYCMKGEAIDWQFSHAFQVLRPVGINYEGGVLSESIRQTIQMTHRAGALILTAYFLIFMFVSVPLVKRVPEMMAAIFLMLGLLLIQLCLGIANVIFKLPLSTALGHTLVAALLLLSVLTLAQKIAFYAGDRDA